MTMWTKVTFVFFYLTLCLKESSSIRDTCRSIIFLPTINLELISEDQFRHAVCSNRDFRYVSSLTCHHDCLNEQLSKLDGGSEALESCWEYMVGQPPPQGQREISKFFCQHRNSWILKNLADHCTVSNVTRGFSDKVVLKELSKCPGVSIFGRKFATPRSLLGNYEYPVRGKDIFAPLMTMLGAQERIHRMCIRNEDKLFDLQIQENECFLSSHPERREDVLDCWNLMTNSTYPVTRDDWRKFMCHNDDPFGVREGFEFCLMNRYGLRRHERCDRFHLLQPSYHIFRPTLPETSVHRYTQLYENRMLTKKPTVDKNLSTSKTSGNSLCKDIWRTSEDGSTRLKYTSVVKRFLKSTPIICLASSASEEYSDVIDGCFDFVVPQFKKMRENLKTDSVRSFSDNEWVKFACDLEDPDEVFSSVRKCVKISVLRANEWMKSSRLLGKFKRGHSRGTPAGSFIQAFKTCLA